MPLNTTQKELQAWADELRAKTLGTGTCFLLLTWPAEIGLREGAELGASSNLNITSSALHLKNVLQEFLRGVFVAAAQVGWSTCPSCGAVAPLRGYCTALSEEPRYQVDCEACHTTTLVGPNEGFGT